MLNNAFVEQNTVTSLRTKLKNTIYKDFRFSNILLENIKKVIPIFSYDYDYDENVVKIIIDKNRCEDMIPNFIHKKEFYMPIFHNVLLSSYDAMLHIYNADKNTPENQEIVEQTIYACNNTICSYKMLDVTAILNNAIIIYL